MGYHRAIGKWHLGRQPVFSDAAGLDEFRDGWQHHFLNPQNFIDSKGDW
jgi:arylsulfatase A-like enzyme